MLNPFMNYLCTSLINIINRVMRKSSILCLVISLFTALPSSAQQYMLVGSKAKIHYKHNYNEHTSKPVYHKETTLSPEDIIITSKPFSIIVKNGNGRTIYCPSSAPDGTKLRELILRKIAYKAPESNTSTYKGEDLNINNIIKSELSTPSSTVFHYLIIGVHEFEDSHWKSLPVPKVNVENMSRAIDEFMIPNNDFHLSNHMQLINAEETTRSNILASINALVDSVKPNNNEMVLLYISSHGIKDSKSKFHIIVSDTHFDSLSSAPLNSITADTLISCVNRLEKKGAKVLCFVDACYSGTILMDIRQSEGSSVYYMSTANDLVAYEDENTGSPFARALTRSLSGEEQYFFKDVSNNNVTPENLQDYLFTSVQNEKKDQRPVTWRSDRISKQRLWSIKSSYSIQLDSLMTAAEYGNTDALVELGDIFADSIKAAKFEVGQDTAMALEYYDWAYELRNPMAACRLGQYYYYLPTPDYNKAFKYFEESAEGNCNLGIYYLCVCHAKGRGTAKSEKKAKKTLNNLLIIDNDIKEAFKKETIFYSVPVKAKDCISILSSQENCLVLENGNVNYVISMHVSPEDIYNEYPYLPFLKKAQKGKAKYQVKYAEMNLYGLNKLSVDYEEAYKWYDEAAKQGNADGFYGLGLIYANGYGVDKDYVKAIENLNISVQKNHTKACVLCGKLYFEGGYGLDKDERHAVELWIKAAELNDPEGLFRYGLCLKDGIQVPRNETKAYECFKKSAEIGDIESQYMVGYCLFNGVGVKQNKEEAYLWLTKAKEKGNELAKQLIYEGYYAGGIPRNE